MVKSGKGGVEIGGRRLLTLAYADNVEMVNKVNDEGVEEISEEERIKGKKSGRSDKRGKEDWEEMV